MFRLPNSKAISKMTITLAQWNNLRIAKNATEKGSDLRSSNSRFSSRGGGAVVSGLADQLRTIDPGMMLIWWLCKATRLQISLS
jgi:hypothetical protein